MLLSGKNRGATGATFNKAALLLALAPLAACGGSSEASATPKAEAEAPTVDDGLEIAGVTGGVVCAPATVRITNRGATARVVAVEGLGTVFAGLDFRNLGPQETWEIAFRGVPGEIQSGRTFQISSGTTRQLQLRLRGAPLDGPSTATITTQALESSRYGDALGFQNTTDRSLPAYAVVSGDLENTGSTLRLEPGEHIVPLLKRVGPRIAGATLHARVEIVTGECEPVSKTVDVTVTP